ncbi:Sec-independent protein translocase subunit TatA [Xenorhabdus nematophila]|uniref:Sec-independent protein translocase protein TatA n=1 Tax=Xenorhabdus nematophila (strain ATCC 19061 / DSM 3370 / CCUG 14189 / LMG 1036 / NCIMB 9965 / AN6) TaxID=406817 RepID=D3VBS2_XENNA|nr:Sec-independent protein translocase subunit TatA [Xenorhabdus nematophila]CEE90645.1 twin-arginine translocase subunit, sec-independent protein export [Xenorhabdus nematophila str. Anatoliense]CEF28863.1 twin-arginine translocase subunit, sec-independent protein export [Xenorhabdus nematophila str. Websteri]AYA42254.1 twin-arginine translocase TatA/TatE family subunit [Xenorhabdus nematophila]KHD28707.1 preprotein translocase subunit TatA [Xenorhabdus nematophila]MBA0020979.1 Sec-independen
MGGISIWQLLIIAVIVVLLFGTNKLRTLGSDLGESIKGFKKAISDDEKEAKSVKAEKMSHDADFEPKNLTEKSEAEPSAKPESKNKEQV